MYVEWGPVESGLNLFLSALTVSGNNLGTGLTLAQPGHSVKSARGEAHTLGRIESLVLGYMVTHQGGNWAKPCQSSVKLSPGVKQHFFKDPRAVFATCCLRPRLTDF